jgi:hypothetical protein
LINLMFFIILRASSFIKLPAFCLLAGLTVDLQMLIKGSLNMKEKLTERFLKSIIPQKRPYEVVDTEINGFILRVQPSGVLAYYLVYRTTHGIKKRYRLGRHGAITLTQASKGVS